MAPARVFNQRVWLGPVLTWSQCLRAIYVLLDWSVWHVCTFFSVFQTEQTFEIAFFSVSLRLPLSYCSSQSLWYLKRSIKQSSKQGKVTVLCSNRIIVLQIRGGLLKDVLATGCKTALDACSVWMFFSRRTLRVNVFLAVHPPGEAEGGLWVTRWG